MTARLAVDEPPDALLLDFGGVLVSSRRQPGGLATAAAAVADHLRRRDVAGPTEEAILDDLVRADEEWDDWKRRRSRDAAPREITHQEFWSRFVAARWNEPARRAVVDGAFELCAELVRAEAVRAPKVGARELLMSARALAIPVAVVSNALSGQVHRELLAEWELDGFIGAQLYSDELGIRKPNPAMLRDAADRVSADIERCWYVGDQHDRDVLAGRRAGAGLTVLMQDGPRSAPPNRRVRPDLVVSALGELVSLLATCDAASKASSA